MLIYETRNMQAMSPLLFDEIVHKALSNDARREILLALSKKEKYLTELAEELGKKPQTIDFHLSLLSEIGLVDSEWKEGKKYYSLKDKRILDFLRDRKPVPPGMRPKPPHELILEAISKLNKRLDGIERKIEQIKKG